ncbi:UvrD-helicase domain-containing protein [Blastococcus brunescens]|uniref:DNA 3'-5' helicase n=1 Tax=Blastococcus brunescens TaxID=1564165 RepID=A0ABZ1B2J5_9ACTN|nr:UvrD-helicase domain-containing protein [Blastococcus sp. BMG 8361]WRL65037.1 UvrD-helicase domain-containing protein [Blastococcus sp. BMG 8361]
MSAATPPAVVDLRGPLPTGTSVLEASAGTGKTYTIAGLVTRYIAEGHARLGELLVVTFGRAATSELRTRVRERLVTARDALADPATGRGSADPVVALLADGTAAEVAERHARLTEALAGFDAATVATIHQFCQQVLQGLGIVADVDPGTELVTDLADLVAEVCDDLYLLFHCRPGSPPASFTHERARAVARAAVIEDPQAVLAPDDADRDTPADLQWRFARAVREEVERRKRRARVQGFDDLLVRVRDALDHPATGKQARERLRERYRVVLVDEFQDTDPVQWDVFRLAFHDSRDLVLIGDPKQAIYAFRGADVRAYLSAAQAATTRATLDTNWRSDTGLLAGLETVFRGAALGDPAIVVRPVRAGHAGCAVGPTADPAPVRMRVLPRAGLELKGRAQLIQVDAARRAVAADLATQVQALLEEEATIVPRGPGGAPRPLVPRDVAVLVRTKAQADLVRDVLQARGFPTVVTGTSSVFGTDAARDWVLLLEALEQPHRRRRVRRLALTPLIGSSAAELEAGGQEATDELADALRRWEDVLRRRGVAGLFAAVAQERALAARLLSLPDGERLVTDRRHVAEALHAEALESSLGIGGLLAWLRARIDEARGDLDQERSRRLDTDDAAIQVVTVHASKGLEFPVVFLPFAWDAFGGGTWERLPRSYDAVGRRVRYVGGRNGPGYAAACRAEDADSAGEELRLLYVAATRAVSRLVLWWAPSTKTQPSPLHRLLFSPDPSVAMPVNVAVPDNDGDAMSRLQAVAAGPRGGVRVEPVPAAGAGPVAAPPAPAGGVDGTLTAARLGRPVDTDWRRTSYTALTRDTHSAGAASARNRTSSGRTTRTTPPRSPAISRPRTSRPIRCPRWPRSPVAPPSARWCTPSWRRPSSRPTTRSRRCARRPDGRCSGTVGGSTRTRSPRHWCPRCARRWGRWPTGVRSATSRAATCSPNSTSSCRWPAATSWTATCGSGRWPGCWTSTCPPATAWPATPRPFATRSSPGSRCAAT